MKTIWQAYDDFDFGRAKKADEERLSLSQFASMIEVSPQ
jgi:hypothetical protein